jgi:shikimate kinase
MSDQHPKLIFLVGFMGSGKSHEGNLLAKYMGLPFIDLDHWIEDQQGKSISALFKTEGENSFRNIEAAALQQAAEQLLSQAPSPDASSHFVGIMSTGGGTPCFHDNMDWMNANGITIWLNLSVDILVNRLSSEKSKRPLITELNDNELHQYIEKKLEERYPYYSKWTITINDICDLKTLTQKISNA